MHHDAIVVKLATIEAEANVLERENARLQSQITKDFDPNLITYSIAVGKVLFNLKDAFVDQMKRLHESYTYQFLERRPFAYDDSSVAMLEAWMANNMVNRLQRMEHIGNQVEKFNMHPEPMENSIVLSRKDHPEAFTSLDTFGNMTFVLTGTFLEHLLTTLAGDHFKLVLETRQKSKITCILSVGPQMDICPLFKNNFSRSYGSFRQRLNGTGTENNIMLKCSH